jgi:hypothetical protein
VSPLKSTFWGTFKKIAQNRHARELTSLARIPVSLADIPLISPTPGSGPAIVLLLHAVMVHPSPRAHNCLPVFPGSSLAHSFQVLTSFFEQLKDNALWQAQKLPVHLLGTIHGSIENGDVVRDFLKARLEWIRQAVLTDGNLGGATHTHTHRGLPGSRTHPHTPLSSLLTLLLVPLAPVHCCARATTDCNSLIDTSAS